MPICWLDERILFAQSQLTSASGDTQITGDCGRAGGYSFGVEDGCQTMNYGRQAHGGQDRFLRHAFVAEHLLVRIDAESAAIDGRDGRAPEFEIYGIDAVSAQNIHAQAGGESGILRIFSQVLEAVIDIVHAHDGGGALGRFQSLRRQVRSRFRERGLNDLRVAGRDSGCGHGAPDLLFVQFLLLQQRREVQLQIFGVGGHGVEKFIESHRSLTFL